MKICCYLFNGLLNVFDHKVIKTSTSSKRIVSFDSRGSWSVFQKFQKCILIEGFKSFCKKSSKQVGTNNRKIDFRIMKKKTRPWKKTQSQTTSFCCFFDLKKNLRINQLRNFGWWQSRWIEKWIWRWSMKFLLTDLMAAVKGWPRHRKTRVRRPSGPRRLCKQSLWT